MSLDGTLLWLYHSELHAESEYSQNITAKSANILPLMPFQWKRPRLMSEARYHANAPTDAFRFRAPYLVSSTRRVGSVAAAARESCRCFSHDHNLSIYAWTSAETLLT